VLVIDERENGTRALDLIYDLPIVPIMRPLHYLLMNTPPMYQRPYCAAPRGTISFMTAPKQSNRDKVASQKAKKGVVI